MKNINRRNFIKDVVVAGAAGMAGTDAYAGLIKENKEIGDIAENGYGPEGIAPSGLFHYNSDGKFRILQLTDTHYISGDPRSVRAVKNVNEMISLEKPDLIIHTGDVIFGSPAEKSMREILGEISKYKIPFAVTLGNHDAEYDKNRTELLDIIKTIPYNITSAVRGIYGVTNYILALCPSESNRPERVLYIFDSNAYSRIKGIGGYDHIRFDQIGWYRKNSMAFRNGNGGNPVRSLAFFHIPLPEYELATRDDAGGKMTGTREEAVSCPAVNSGLWASMKEMGDVEAMFAGHDHNNDFSVYWNNMFFIYGRFSGCDTVYNDLKPNGARVIELTEGTGGFRSWIRLYGGRVIQDRKYPEDFVKK
ncbi:MAG: metallophosphoesterase family protein [Bacteroidales bacterium]|jgi:3',5'-cyclic AMP phosphodiesterase CpdA|nr:metallophosphoesterase family protein [Bacteroidales bacterium]